MVLEKIISYNSAEDNLYHAINLSPSSLRNPNFISRAKEILKESGSNNSLMFILSENEYYSHIDKYNSIIKSFKSLGVKMVIDRLGSIHTSFLYLRELDIDVVRFDSFYTKDIDKQEYKSILEGFNVMAHAKGVKSWMKLVESKETQEYAQLLGVDYLQGKYLSELEKTYEN